MDKESFDPKGIYFFLGTNCTAPVVALGPADAKTTQENNAQDDCPE